MSRLLDIARRVRHAPGLPSAEGLWRWLRRPFHLLLDPWQRGVAVELAHDRRIRLPADLTGRFAGWRHYEPEAVDRMADWIAAHPDAQILDVGCAVGMFTALALHASGRTRVIAFDADLASLKMTQRVAKVARDPGRLRLVHGLISNQHRTGGTLAMAVNNTSSALHALTEAQAEASARYVCIEDEGRSALPEYSIDELLAGAATASRGTLFKCDVEGAEVFVLNGAQRWLKEVRPTLLLSVHPPALRKLGHSVEEIERLLRDANYQWEVIGRDHEEHWWVEPRLELATGR